MNSTIRISKVDRETWKAKRGKPRQIKEQELVDNFFALELGIDIKEFQRRFKKFGNKSKQECKYVDARKGTKIVERKSGNLFEIKSIVAQKIRKKKLKDICKTDILWIKGADDKIAEAQAIDVPFEDNGQFFVEAFYSFDSDGKQKIVKGKFKLSDVSAVFPRNEYKQFKKEKAKRK